MKNAQFKIIKNKTIEWLRSLPSENVVNNWNYWNM